MKIIFFGTPGFAVPGLEILAKNYEVAAVVTAPGKQAGRGLKIKEPEVKEAADRLGIPTIQPVKLNDTEFLHDLELLNADLFVVVAFRMMPQALWMMPPLGTFNLHASLLPQYRGAAPINHAIINGEKETGVTTFFLKHEIDTGNIIFRERLNIGDNETAGELHDRLKELGAALVLKTVQAIENQNVILHPQEEFIKEGDELKSAPKIFLRDCVLDFTKTCEEVHNRVRGLSPYPGAYTNLVDPAGHPVRLKIYKTLLTDIKENAPGKLSTNGKQLYISCSDGNLEILELQLEGKKRMKASDFLNGINISNYSLSYPDN